MFKINEMALLVFLLYYSAIVSGEYKEEFQEFEVDCLSENVFECQSGSCILQERFCDGNYDCKDGSDENFCGKCYLYYTLYIIEVVYSIILQYWVFLYT